MVTISRYTPPYYNRQLILLHISHYKDAISQVYLGPRMRRFPGLSHLSFTTEPIKENKSVLSLLPLQHPTAKLAFNSYCSRTVALGATSYLFVCLNIYVENSENIDIPLGWINHGREAPLHSTEPKLKMLCPLVAFHRLIHRSVEHS